MSNDSNDDFSLNSLPDDAPPDLKIMATNIQEMLTPILSIRGAKYHEVLMIFMCISSQVRELEDIACESTKLISSIGEQEWFPTEDRENLLNGAETRHHMTHFYASSISRHMDMAVTFIESLSNFNGFSKDLNALLERINHDWKRKGH